MRERSQGCARLARRPSPARALCGLAACGRRTPATRPRREPGGSCRRGRAPAPLPGEGPGQLGLVISEIGPGDPVERHVDDRTGRQLGGPRRMLLPAEGVRAGLEPEGDTSEAQLAPDDVPLSVLLVTPGPPARGRARRWNENGSRLRRTAPSASARAPLSRSNIEASDRPTKTSSPPPLRATTLPAHSCQRRGQ
jgi:hypothetical protein